MEIDKLEENLKELSVELTALKHITDRLDKKGNQQIYEWQQNVELMAGDNDEMQAQLYTLRRPYASNNHNVRVELDETVIKELNVKVIQNLEAVQALKERAFETFLLQITEDKLKRYSHDDLIMFTSKFSNKIGFGGFSKVYLGRLSDGVKVAIKVLTQNRDIPKDVLRHIFVIEVTTMIKASHPNLIKLYGFCFDDNMKALIYEYMENGSLDKVLFKKHIVVEWRRLYEIAIDTAKVLAYLHHDCDDQIIHHDVKPANILLDSNLSPKVTDFGVAKIMNRDATHFTMTRTRGTSCYIAPEMTMQASRVTYTCDVYSFGMTLFDILGMRINSQIQPSFPNEVWRKFDKGKLDEIIKGCDIWEEDEESARILSIVALWCIQFTPEARPSMKDVVNVLEKKLQVAVPPNPFLASDKLFSIRQSQDMTYSRISTSSHQRSSAAQDTPAQFASQGESQIKGLPEEMTRKQPSFSEMLGSEMDDSDASGREPSAHWGSGNSPYLTPTHDDPNSLFSPYLPPVLEEQSSSFSEAGEDDPMPAIDGLQISGDAFPGQYLQACGYSINGTTSCNFEWVHYLEDGSVNYIDGAKQPNYLVTADDVDTYLAVEVQPLDNRKRKGEIVKVSANEQRKITCDLEMKEQIERSLHNGNTSFDVSLAAKSLDIWVPAILAIKREGYSIKCTGALGGVVTEKFMQNTTVAIPYGHPTAFLILGSSEHLLRTESSTLRDTIVLTMRLFIMKLFGSIPTWFSS